MMNKKKIKLPDDHGSAVAIVMEDWRLGDCKVDSMDADRILTIEVDRLTAWLKVNSLESRLPSLPVIMNETSQKYDMAQKRINKANEYEPGHEERVRALAQAVTILRGAVSSENRLLGNR